MERYTGRGLAQGDPLSPLLFNIATMNICHQIDQAHISQYADDFVIYCTGENINALQLQLQNSLNKIIAMLHDLGLEISTTKTKVCIFLKGYKQLSVNIKIYNQVIEVVPFVRYLGLWLDSGLRWSKHINEVFGKTYKYINVLKVLGGTSWGVHPKHLRSIYIAVVRSRLDYASFLFNDSAQCHTNKLDKIQNQAMRVVGSFIKTTPIHVMQSELSLPPLDIRRFYLAAKFWLKCKSLQYNTCLVTLLDDIDSTRNWTRKKEPLLLTIHKNFREINVHCSVAPEFFTSNQWVTYIDVSDVIYPKIETVSKSKENYPCDVLRQICDEFINENFSEFYKIYTDGSKDSNNIGAAFFDPQEVTSVRFKIESEISIMTAELIAIAEALSYAETINKTNIVIFTDSRSSLQHIARCTSTFRGVPTAYTILDSIMKCKDQNKIIKIQWLPAHVGITQNEIADQLAKEACSEGIRMQPLPYYADKLPKVKGRCLELWKQYFDKRSKEVGIWYKTIQPEPLQSAWIKRSKLTRFELIILMRLRSGHVPTNKFKFLMRKADGPNCSVCNILDDVYHILVECVRGGPYRYNINVGSCISALANPSSEEARALIQLYKKCICDV